MRTAAGRIFATANRERSRLCCLCFLLFKTPRLMLLLAEADLPVTAIQIGVFIGCCSFLLAMYRNWIGIQADNARMKQGTGERPVHLASPIRMELEREFADRLTTERDVNGLKEKTAAIELKIVADLAAIKLAGERRATDIKDSIAAKIDDVMKDVFHRVNENDKAIAAMQKQQQSHDDELRAWRT